MVTPSSETRGARAKRGRDRSRALLYRHYHGRGWKGAFRRYEELLESLVKPPSVVLDVGCGRGFPAADLLLRLGAEVHGLDPMADPAAAPPKTTVRSGLADAIPYPDGKFDLLTSRSVLEHLQEPARAFREFRRVLKPGGHLAFLVPNRYDYVSIAASLIPNSLHASIMRRLEGRDEHNTFPTYYRANSVRQIACLAARTGFEVVRLEYLNHYPYLLTFSPLLCRAGIAYDELIGRVRWLHWLRAWLLGVLRCAERQPSGGAGARSIRVSET
jgi:SAM-dependent methyltransferase